MIAAGKLRQRITIEQRSSIQDPCGQPLEVWSSVASDIAANIKHLSGMQAIKAGAEVSTVSAAIRIRYRPGLNAGMRIKHGRTFYAINAVLPFQQDGFIDLVCQISK